LAAAKLGRLVLGQFVRCEHPHWKACVHNSSSVEFIRREQGSTVACVARATATATAAWGQRLLTRVTATMICELSGALVRITASQHRRNYSIIVRATYGTAPYTHGPWLELRRRVVGIAWIAHGRLGDATQQRRPSVLPPLTETNVDFDE